MTSGPHMMSWSRVSKRWGRAVVFASLSAVMAVAQLIGPAEAQGVGGGATVRLLTQDEYRNVIADVFGTDIKLAGRFEPDLRVNGLIAVGAGKAGVTGSALEQYDNMARAIGSEVTDERHRVLFVPCAPKSIHDPDPACAKRFLAEMGELLFRRPLMDDELAYFVDSATQTTTHTGDFYTGLGFGLAGILSSPQFLFRLEVSEEDPAHPGLRRLTAYSKAERLSFLLWNSGPDQALLAAAKSGALHTKKGLDEQVERMLASPRLENGVRAFFTDMLEFDQFDTLGKDTTLYPNYTAEVAEQAKEQTLRTIVNLLVRDRGDYRDLFTTRKSEMTARLGSLYRVPVSPRDGVIDAWTPYEFAPDSGHAGIITHASFLALHSHPGQTSPTIRGKALREVFLCQKVPDPPATVDFSRFNEATAARTKTVRERLQMHSESPVCAGCHRITDPVGLTLEKFDTVGGFRAIENGTPIDTSGEMNGVKYEDPVGLGAALHDNKSVPSCLVSRLYSYGVGRPPAAEESKWLSGELANQFAADRYRLPALLRRIATSDAFYQIVPTALSASVSSK